MHLTRCAAAILSLTIGATAQANLITNGSFETPTVPGGPGTYQKYFGGSTAITGWTVVGVDVDVANAYEEHGTLFLAQEGNQFINLVGAYVPNGVLTTNGVTQDVSTTIDQVYDLSFYVGSLNKGGGYNLGTVDVSINGGSRVTYHNPDFRDPPDLLDWKHFTHQFTATSSTTNITFFNGATNSVLAALDNVSLTTATVEAVPEPTSSALLVIGSAGIMCARFRRGRRAKEV